MVKKTVITILLLILSYWTISPLLENGFFPMHDDTQVGRVVTMGRALKNGQFPVRWVSDLGYGYGYPLYNFYAPLPYYVGGLFYLLGMSGLVATKFMLLLGIFLPALTLFFVLWKTYGVIGSLLASLLYVYAPYHAVQIYVRGAVGEFWTLIFYPLIVWGLLKKSVLVGAIGVAGVILSHTLLGYATVVFLVVGLSAYWFLQAIKKRFHYSLFTIHYSLIILGLGLSAFFWLPALVEMKYTNVAGQVSSTAAFRDHFVCLSQLWDSLWGFGGSSDGCIDGLSFKLGKLHILLAAPTFILIVVRHRAIHHWAWLGFIVTLSAVFLMLPASTIVWETIPGMAYFQYPWRFLAWATFGLSIMAGALVEFFPSKMQWFFLLLIPILIDGSTKMFQPQYLIQKPQREYEEKRELRSRVSKISDEYLPAAVPRPETERDVASALVPDTIVSKSTTEVDQETYARVRLFADSATTITFAGAYFPGWRYFLNAREINPTIENGLPRLAIPAGENLFEARFTNTPVRLIGNLISLGTVLAILFL